MAIIYLGLGSNEAPGKNLRLALAELRMRYNDVQASGTYRNAAVGFDGADFLNLVVRIESDESALDLCKTIELIHNLAGRVSGSDKWGARPLDIDLLLYNDLVCEDKPIRVPREDILEYSFVLRPLAELAPELKHPVTGKTYREHWREFDASRHPLQPVDVDLLWSTNV